MLLICMCMVSYFFFFKQKTAYEMRISDWSSDVCSSDLGKVQGHRKWRIPDGHCDTRPLARKPDPHRGGHELRVLREARRGCRGTRAGRGGKQREPRQRKTDGAHPRRLLANRLGQGGAEGRLRRRRAPARGRG